VTGAGTQETATVAPSSAPCDLLTADEVAAAVGIAVMAVTEQPPISCVFDFGPDAGVDIFVAVDDGQGRASGPAALFADYSSRLDAGTAESVDGVGVAAAFDPGFRTLAVDAGSGRFIAVGVNGGYDALAEPRSALTDLARIAVDRL
jgi:hypothetical protein